MLIEDTPRPGPGPGPGPDPPEPYKDEIGLRMGSGPLPNRLLLSNFISRSSRNRGRPRFLCWTSTHASSLPLLKHLEQGRWAVQS